MRTDVVMRGAYFLANDSVLDFAIAFLNSFRAHNPDLPLCLVPFDDKVDGILSLQSQYDFSIFRDDAALRQCDDLSVRLHGFVVGHYRKLALWQGDYDEFVYVDTDTVVLTNLAFVFPLVQTFGFLASHSDIPSIRKWTWKDSIRDVGQLTERQVWFSANTGFFATRKGYLSLVDAVDKLPSALALSQHMALGCAEQPFMNYLVVTSGQPYTSLHVLRCWTGLDVPLERWAGAEIGTVCNGCIVSAPTRVLLVHWAGLGWKLREGQLPHFDLWNHYRRLRGTAPGRIFTSGVAPGV